MFVLLLTGRYWTNGGYIKKAQVMIMADEIQNQEAAEANAGVKPEKKKKEKNAET
jgi:hypothetical protein